MNNHCPLLTHYFLHICFISTILISLFYAINRVYLCIYIHKKKVRNHYINSGQNNDQSASIFRCFVFDEL